MRRMFTIEEIEDIGVGGAVSSINGKTGAVVLTGADLKASPSETEKVSEKLNRIDSTLIDYGGQLARHDSELSSIEAALAGKQDALTAGENITIEDNVISASGGFEPFRPIINISTFGQIMDAYTEGKAIELVYHPDQYGTTFLLPLIEYDESVEHERFIFGGIIKEKSYVASVDATGYWSPVVETEMIKASSKVTSLSGSSTDAQIPSAKAVVDYVGAHGAPAEYIKRASVSGNTLTLTDQDNDEVEFTAQAAFVPAYGTELPATGSTGDLFFKLEV